MVSFFQCVWVFQEDIFGTVKSLFSVVVNVGPMMGSSLSYRSREACIIHVTSFSVEFCDFI